MPQIENLNPAFFFLKRINSTFNPVQARSRMSESDSRLSHSSKIRHSTQRLFESNLIRLISQMSRIEN